MKIKLHNFFAIFGLVILSLQLSAQCNVSGGNISTQDITSVCTTDGQITYAISGAQGANQIVTIIDQNTNEFISFSESSTIAFEGYSNGVYAIKHLSYEDGLQGLNIGDRFPDLVGCFSFSNTSFVTVLQSEAGTISSINGTSSVQICNDKIIPFSRIDDTGIVQFWVVTNSDGSIVKFLSNSQNLSSDTNIDFGDLESGDYLVLNAGTGFIEFIIGFDLKIGDNIFAPMRCLNISNAISVTIESGCGDDPSDEDEDCIEVTDDRQCRGNRVLMCKNDRTICVRPNRVDRQLSRGAVLGACTRCIVSSLKTNSVPISKAPSNELEINIFPNPVSNILNIVSNNTNKETIEIYNVQGQLITTKTKEENTSDTKVSLSNFEEGVYFVKIINQENTFTKTILVQK